MNILTRFFAVIALVVLLPQPVHAGSSPEVDIADIMQTVVKMSVVDGVSLSDAADAMVSKASELNLKLVGRQKVHEEIRARGKESPHLEILQFCDPDDAVKMVVLDPVYAAYMPCRIALVEDAKGKPWLYMLNLDMLINSDVLPPELQAIAIRVNQSMLAIMTSGATGDF